MKTNFDRVFGLESKPTPILKEYLTDLRKTHTEAARLSCARLSRSSALPIVVTHNHKGCKGKVQKGAYIHVFSVPILIHSNQPYYIFHLLLSDIFQIHLQRLQQLFSDKRGLFTMSHGSFGGFQGTGQQNEEQRHGSAAYSAHQGFQSPRC